MSPEQDETVPSKRLLRKLARVSRRITRIAVILFVCWLVVMLVGLFPVNNDFTSSPDGVEILVVSNEVHADLIVPIGSPHIDWAERFSKAHFSGDVSQATHVAIGWGDKGFFIDTPTWDELRFSTAAQALFVPSDACLHVKFVDLKMYQDTGRVVQISNEQYERLISFINSSFKVGEDGAPLQIPDAAYGQRDAFFEAHGTYHGMNTCNSWVGRALKSAGVRVGVYTPLPKSVYLHLPDVEKRR